MCMCSCLFLVFCLFFVVASTSSEIESLHQHPKDDCPFPSQVSVETLTMSFLLPSKRHFSGSQRQRLRELFSKHHISISQPPVGSAIIYRLQLNPVYLEDLGTRQVIHSVFCSPAAKGVNALFILVDEAFQGDQGNQVANFVHLVASAAGIPTLAWSSSTSELDGASSLSAPLFISAPTLRSYAEAVMAYITTQPKSRFSIIASVDSAGHDLFINFIMALHRRHLMVEELNDDDYMEERQRIHNRILPTDWRRTLRSDLLLIRGSDNRHQVVIVFTEEDIANEVLREAAALGMTSSQFTWLGMRPVLGNNNQGSRLTNMVPGSVVVTYNMSTSAQLDALDNGIKLWVRSINSFVKFTNVTVDNIAPVGMCNTTNNKPWIHRDLFSRLLVQTEMDCLKEGLMAHQVMFLELSDKHKWKEIGQWNVSGGLVMSDRVNQQHVKQVKKFKVATLPEDPFVIYKELVSVTSDQKPVCPPATIPCCLSPLHPSIDNATLVDPNYGGTFACATGLFIDLLQRLAKDISFEVDLFEVYDRKWGALDKSGEWNGLVRALMTEEADMVVTSLKINKERSEVVDFSMPVLETGITMVVAVKDETASATAFLEPFSVHAWAGIFGTAVICAVVIFAFEYYCSQDNVLDKSGGNLSIFGALWFVFNLLLKSNASIEIPQRSTAAKAMCVIWAIFCVIFVSSYTANLAVFMITKESFYDFSGLDDSRIANPLSKNPPWKFGTITSGATETYLKFNYPEVYAAVREHSQVSVVNVISAVKNGLLDAFIYDAAALDFKVKRDENCLLRLTGKVHANTGYGVAFPRGSAWLKVFDKHLIEYRSKGFLEGLRSYWMSGKCADQLDSGISKSLKLGWRNMQSAAVFLLIGIGVSFIIMPYRKPFPVTKPDEGQRRFRLRINKIVESVSRIFSVDPRNRLFKVDFDGQVAVEICHNCKGVGHQEVACTSPKLKFVTLN